MAQPPKPRPTKPLKFVMKSVKSGFYKEFAFAADAIESVIISREASRTWSGKGNVIKWKVTVNGEIVFFGTERGARAAQKKAMPYV